MFSHFYHRLIRKYVSLFGALFNNLYTYRYTSAGMERERTKVPLTYSPKEKFLTRLKSDPTLTKSILTTLPRIAFEITGISYDADRKQQSTLKLQGPTVGTSAATMYMAAPYTLDFSLSIYARNIEDATQIVEQILPYFQPDFTVTALLIPELQLKKDIPILLTTVNQQIDYEGGFDSTRLIIWTLDFSMKAFFFGPVGTTGLISGISGNTGANTGGSHMSALIDSNLGLDSEQVILSSGNTIFKLGEVVTNSDRTFFATVKDWDASTQTMTLANITGSLQANTVLRGSDTNVRRTVTSLVRPTAGVTITVKQTPLIATMDDDFGFSVVVEEHE